MQIGFYFHQTRCTGCSACRVACKDWNDIPAGPENWMRVHYTEKGKFPKPFVSYMVAACWHCAEPVCAVACPVDCISLQANEDDHGRRYPEFFRINFSRASPSIPLTRSARLPESFIPISVATKGRISPKSSGATCLIAVSSLLRATAPLSSSPIRAHCFKRSMIG